MNSLKKGFTLIEVLIAVSVFSVAIMVFLQAINRSLSSVIENKRNYEAFYYSKELYEGIKAGVYESDYKETGSKKIEFPGYGERDSDYYRVAEVNGHGELEVRCYGKEGRVLLEIPKK